jgi:hypothetical protein
MASPSMKQAGTGVQHDAVAQMVGRGKDMAQSTDGFQHAEWRIAGFRFS